MAKIHSMSEENSAGYDCEPLDDGRDRFDCGHYGFEEEAVTIGGRTVCVNCGLGFSQPSVESQPPEETGHFRAHNYDIEEWMDFEEGGDWEWVGETGDIKLTEYIVELLNRELKSKHDTLISSGESKSTATVREQEPDELSLNEIRKVMDSEDREFAK